MAATVETSTQYEELVARGREARERADDMQWIEGDLALQIEALPANERPRDPETGDFVADPDKALKRYADDIEITYRTLQDYRRTAQCWPPRARAAASWRTHNRLNALEDRFALIRDGMTNREAERLARERSVANYSGEPGWFELLGIVGDTLTKADKQLAKAEDAIEGPREELIAKAYEYASWADGLASRLRAIAES